MRKTAISIIAVLGLSETSIAQENHINKETYLYATRDGWELRLDRYEDNSVESEGKRPWMFFHGAKDQLVTYEEIHEGFGGYGPVSVCKQFDTMEVPYWFYDYPDGDHLISGAPMIDSKSEIEIFLTKFLQENQELFIHTIEQETVSKDFSNFIKLYGDNYKSN